MPCTHLLCADDCNRIKRLSPKNHQKLFSSIPPCRDAGERWPCPYKFGDKQVKTDKWLLLERGTSQRYFPMALVRAACWFWGISVALALHSWIRGCCFPRAAGRGFLSLIIVCRGV